jgi:transcriptional regulator with XRE-family HTH domain
MCYYLCMAHDDKGIGPRIAAARRDAGLSQPQLAEATGNSPRTIQSWELGDRHPRYEALVRLAKALCISVADLYADASPESKKAA